MPFLGAVGMRMMIKKKTKLDFSHEPNQNVSACIRIRIMCQFWTVGFMVLVSISWFPPQHSRSFQCREKKKNLPQVSLGRRILTTDVAIISLTTLAADALAESAAAPHTPWSAWLVSKLCGWEKGTANSGVAMAGEFWDLTWSNHPGVMYSYVTSGQFREHPKLGGASPGRSVVID